MGNCCILKWQYAFKLTVIFFFFGFLWLLLKALALSACTTLVTVEPKLTIETRNHVMKVYLLGIYCLHAWCTYMYAFTLFWVLQWKFWQATLGFFALPNDPIDVVNPLIDNLITLLCAILLTRYSWTGRYMFSELLFWIAYYLGKHHILVWFICLI